MGKIPLAVYAFAILLSLCLVIYGWHSDDMDLQILGLVVIAASLFEIVRRKLAIHPIKK